MAYIETTCWIVIVSICHLPGVEAKVPSIRLPVFPSSALKLSDVTFNNYVYETKWITMKVDHFNPTDDRTFQMRYLVSDPYKNVTNRAIFFYTGNEGDISWFCNNTGIMWDVQPEFQAMLVFAEHRYYGESLPFGKDSFKGTAHLGYLTAEQALADFAILLRSMKKNVPGISRSPVIAFGGSYGGMLATWMRLKYPNVITGSLAASAPIWLFPGLSNCSGANAVVTKDFEINGTYCTSSIRKSWSVITNMAQTAEGRKNLTKYLRLCYPLETGDDAATVKAWLSETWFNVAMVDYPYAASFLEPLPPYPVKDLCSHFKTAQPSDLTLLSEMANALNVYYNFTGTTKCFNTSVTAVGSLEVKGWSYQACTEMVMPMCSNGKTDMFEPQPWDYDSYAAGCKDYWDVTPRPEWMKTQFWGKDISSASNIIFSNGLRDPWSAGGVLKSLSDSLIAVVIPDGAHHLDLRARTKDDPPSLTKARDMEYQTIRQWLKEYYLKLV